jgi:hypothetical protein
VLSLLFYFFKGIPSWILLKWFPASETQNTKIFVNIRNPAILLQHEIILKARSGAVHGRKTSGFSVMQHVYKDENEHEHRHCHGHGHR